MKNIIFDWSGTLSDDFTLVYNTCMIIMKELGGQELSVNQFKEQFRLPYMDFWHDYFPDVTQEYLNKKFSEVYLTMGNPQVYPGVVQIIEKFKQMGCKMVVLSSTAQDKIETEAKRLNIQDAFIEIIGSVQNKKEVIDQQMQRNNFTSEDTIYVGDMIHDVETGHAVGLKVIGITWGYNTREQLRDADIVVDSIAEVEAYVK